MIVDIFLLREEFLRLYWLCLVHKYSSCHLIHCCLATLFTLKSILCSVLLLWCWGCAHMVLTLSTCGAHALTHMVLMLSTMWKGGEEDASCEWLLSLTALFSFGFNGKLFSLSTLLKPFKLVVLVVFHLYTYSSNPTTMSGYEDDTKEGEDGVCENWLV